MKWAWTHWGTAEAFESDELAVKWTQLTCSSTCRTGHKTLVQGGRLDVKAQDVGNDWISEGSGCCAVIRCVGCLPGGPGDEREAG